MPELSETVSSGFANYYEKLRVDLHTWVASLTEDQFWKNPFPYGNSVGHLVLHASVCGFGERPADSAQLARMSGLLRDALDAGAVGLSTGLAYAPLPYAAEDELLALAAVTAAAGKVFTWHVRSYDEDLLDAVGQAVRVARKARCRTRSRTTRCLIPKAASGSPIAAVTARRCPTSWRRIKSRTAPIPITSTPSTIRCRAARRKDSRS